MKVIRNSTHTLQGHFFNSYISPKQYGSGESDAQVHIQSLVAIHYLQMA